MVSHMAETIVIITDTPIGIKRLAIGAAVLGLGKIGEKLTLEYLFRALRLIEEKTADKIRIILPYAEGLMENEPAYAPSELFYLHKLPARPARISSAVLIYEHNLRDQLVETSNRYGVELLPIDQLDGLARWCDEHIRHDEVVVHVTSGQVALNVELSSRLRQHFDHSQMTSLAAVGHRVGLTPAELTGAAWMNLLRDWSPEYGTPVPVPQNKIEVHPILAEMESNQMRIAYDSGRDTRMAMLMRRRPDLMMMNPEEVANELLVMGDVVEYRIREDRMFNVVLGDRLRYFRDKPSLTFEQQVSTFQQELSLLLDKTGMNIANLDVLEIGAGMGIRSILFRRAGARFVASSDFALSVGVPKQRRFFATWPENDPARQIVDLEENRLKVKDPGLAFMECAGERLPYREACFHLVYSNQVLEHVQSPLECLQEMMRVLKPGGILFLRYNPWFHVAGGHGACTTDIPWGHVLMSPDELEAFFIEVEFPEVAALAKFAVQNSFTPGRMTLGQFEACFEQLLPLDIIHYYTRINRHRNDQITPEMLDLCRRHYPEVTVRDLVTGMVEVILRKIT
jgi:ubiquinone/menaquinone biosynthesis C-methylase UbiE